VGDAYAVVDGFPVFERLFVLPWFLFLGHNSRKPFWCILGIPPL
jgi:hypothetical protein